MSRKSSVTEISTWRHCRVQWHYRYERRLDMADRAPQLAQGVAVHHAIELLLKKEITASMYAGVVEGSMRQSMAQNEYADEGVAKYLPGALRAVEKFLTLEWPVNRVWHIEEKMHYEAAGGQLVTMIPDLWCEHDSENGKIIELVDFKTSKKSPLSYLLFNPQLRYYAVKLQDTFKDAVVQYVYQTLPTDQKSAPSYSPWLLSDKMYKSAKQELDRLAQEVGEGELYPHYSYGCDYCDYDEICSAVITGADPEGIIETKFVVKPTRE